MSCVTAVTLGRGPDPHGKDSGFGRFPSRQFAINRAWLELALVGIWPWATDLANIYARLDALPPTDG